MCGCHIRLILNRMNETLNPNEPIEEGKLEDAKKTEPAVTGAQNVETQASAPAEAKEVVEPEDTAAVEKEEPAHAAVEEPAPAAVEEPAPAAIEEPAPAAVEEPAPAAVEEPAPAAVEEPAPAAVEEPAPAAVEEPAPAAEEEPAPVAEEKEEEEPFEYTFKATREEVIARLKEIAEGEPSKAEKQELEALKQNFYKLHKAAQAAERKTWEEGGGAPEAFVPTPDTWEDDYKAAMNVIKEKRSVLQEEEDKKREQNLTEKLQIIDKLREMVENGNIENSAYSDFKALQQRWKEIKEVPQAKVSELWKKYQLYTERFYDILKLNSEFREYDFKKNLEIKTRLCEEAEKLAEEKDIVSAFHKLQKLHQEWRDTGPVSKDLREEIWGRFKAASTLVNRRHQQHFEELKASEQNNLDQKTVICEIVEAIEYDKLTGYSAWNDKTKEVIALQAKWKTIGFAPQKMNQKIFERFRAACDEFFKRKGEFFKSTKETFNENLEKKRALCEKAEQLKESTEWKETADALTALQKEWKAIGPVPKKYSETIWKRFIEACDYFFEQRGKATSSQRSTEVDNLKQKKGIIAALKELVEGEAGDEVRQQVSDLVARWNAIGHVPFKEKDKIFKEYKELQDTLFDKLHMSDTFRRISAPRSNAGSRDTGTGNRERDRLSRMYESMKSEIMTYENNIGFLSSSSKKGNSLIEEMQQKMERLKADAALVLKKIKDIDAGVTDTAAEAPASTPEAPASAPEAPAEEEKKE